MGTARDCVRLRPTASGRSGVQADCDCVPPPVGGTQDAVAGRSRKTVKKTRSRRDDPVEPSHPMTALHHLLEALAAAPSLPGARCRGRHHLFDEAAPNEAPEVVEQRHAQVLGLCSRCPAADRCRAWFNALPARHRPHGVVAGQLRTQQRGRPRKQHPIHPNPKGTP